MDEGEILKASKADEKIQTIKRTLLNGEKEIKGIALGLCQTKDNHLWYPGKIWILNDEGIQMTLIATQHDLQPAGPSRIAKTTDLLIRQYNWPKIGEYIKPLIKITTNLTGPKLSNMDFTDHEVQTTLLIQRGN